jgi:hypothetical protein
LKGLPEVTELEPYLMKLVWNLDRYSLIELRNLIDHELQREMAAERAESD